MINLEFKEAVTDEDLHTLADMASAIWHEFFPALISLEQIDYMLKKFQSFEAMKQQIKEDNYHYYMLMLDGVPSGYFGVSVKDDGTLFLSKLYLKSELRGKGFASLMWNEVKKIARNEGCEMIWLTVNKGNTHAVNVYKHNGMRLLREECTDIGNGFYMDDYVFGLYV